jgi:hypothetical protein
MSTSALRAELARREEGAAKLARKRDMMAGLLATLEAQLADLGVPGGKRRGRKPGRKPGRKAKRKPGRKAGRKLPKNKHSLGDALAAAVRPGTVVSPAEAMKKVQAAGYKTTAKKFGIVVALRLANHKHFKRKRRGQYERVAA